MEFILKKSLESQFKRMETLKEEYLSEEKKLKESERLYSAEEIFNRNQNFRNKYINITENFVKEVEGYASVWVSTDEAKVDLTDNQKADNALWLSADIMKLTNCGVNDEVAFETVRRYIGDFAIMKRLLSIKQITNYCPVTKNVLRLVNSIKETKQHILEAYANTLKAFKIRFKVSRLGFGSSEEFVGSSSPRGVVAGSCSLPVLGGGLTEALYQREILNLVDLFEKYLNEVETAKTADFNTVSKFFI